MVSKAVEVLNSQEITSYYKGPTANRYEMNK
jgi:hypothetical protein